jgi:hypothetical protein
VRNLAEGMFHLFSDISGVTRFSSPAHA